MVRFFVGLTLAVSRPGQHTIRLGVIETDLQPLQVHKSFLKRRKAQCSPVTVASVALTALSLSVAACQPAKELSEKAPVLVRLTSDPGDEVQPSFSVDGNQVAYAWRKENEDHYDIYIKTLHSEKEQRLTSAPADDYSPAWSPDGKWIAFLRDLGTSRTAVLLAAPAGGSARKLAEVSSGAIHSGLAWHPSGKHLVVSHQNSPDEPAALSLLSVATGETRWLTRPSGGSVLADGEPAVSPDGRRIVFLRMLDTALGDLYLLELSGDLQPKGKPQPLTAKNELATGPVWTSDGQEIIFTLTTGVYRSGLWRTSVSGGEPRRMAFGGDNGVSAAVSPQGHRLAFAEPRRDADIWRLELGGRPRPA
ncbi:MAG: hypothetical protein GY953_16060, partial [bacterium]|nr:hypothetical protein [bacterium]